MAIPSAEATGSFTDAFPGQSGPVTWDQSIGDRAEIDTPLVRELVAARFPQWAAFPLEPRGSDVGGDSSRCSAPRRTTRLRPAERLLVRGAAGGVGNAVVQLGRAYGARVTVLARAANLNFVRALGAHEAIDHRAVPAEELGRFDVVVAPAGTGPRTFRRLRDPGRMVTITIDLTRPAASLSHIAASTVHGTGLLRFFSDNLQRADLDSAHPACGRGRAEPGGARGLPAGADSGGAPGARVGRRTGQVRDPSRRRLTTPPSTVVPDGCGPGIPGTTRRRGTA